MEAKGKNIQRRSLCILRRILLWGVLPLTCLLGALCLAVYLLGSYKPEFISSNVQSYLESATGVPWRIKGPFKPLWSPHLGVSIADVQIPAASAEQSFYAYSARPLVEVKNVKIYLDMASFWELGPRFHMVELDEPSINLAYDVNNRPLWVAPEHTTAEELAETDGASAPSSDAADTAQPTASAATQTTTSNVAQSATPVVAQSTTPDKAQTASQDGVQAAAPATTLDGSQSASDGSQTTIPGATASPDPLQHAADLVCTLPPSILQPVKIKNGSIRHYTSEGALLLAFTGLNGSFDPASPDNNLHLATEFVLPDADLVIRTELDARVGCDGIPATGTLSGRLEMTPPQSRTLAADFSGAFTWSRDGRFVKLPEFSFAAETDALKANLLVDLLHLECTGKVDIEKISLPRWFKFGRILPPGLRQTLDDVRGSFDLALNLSQAMAQNLQGTAGILQVSGLVGVPNFSKPVVHVDLAVDEGNIDLILPFLAPVGKVVPDPVPPVFDHPYLAPYPSRKEAAAAPKKKTEPGIDVSYNVRVRVAKPHVHGVTGGPLNLTVSPVVVGGVEKARVAFTAKALLQGSVNGRLDIDDKFILMRYDVKGMDLRGLPENAANNVKIAGRVNGVCEIDVPFVRNSDFADSWPMRVDAAISGCEITGSYKKKTWRLYGGTVKAKGPSSIYTVRSKGIRIEGLWNVSASGIKTSWNPKGNDSLSGVFDGGLFWPPIADAPRSSARAMHIITRRGVDKVAGKLSIAGSLAVPIGNLTPVIRGKLASDAQWHLYDGIISAKNSTFEGFGSYASGNIDINVAGADAAVKSAVTFKINPGELLKGWKITLPPSIRAPKLATGKANILWQSQALKFDSIKGEVDGAPISGNITWKEDGKKRDAGLWTFRLNANHVNFDNYFPPAKPLPKGQRPPAPSKKRWDLSGLKGLGIDAEVNLSRARWDNLHLAKARVTGTLLRDRFTLHGDCSNFYQGKGTVILQGTVVPDTSKVFLRKALAQMENVDMGRLLQDYIKEKSYGGKANLVFDVSGALASNADFPSKLSGFWSLRIKDGLYPGFLSGENSTVRNSFSKAAASGVMEKGVLRSKNFHLSGPVVDMAGGGWLNLGNREYDLSVSATFAKVPTVPVRIYGSVYEPKMEVRGAVMVVETMQNAGLAVFGLIRGILELPGHAVRGISNAMSKPEKPSEKAAPLAPYKDQTGHPGQ